MVAPAAPVVPPEWQDWQRAREAEMLASGKMSADSAREFAKAEAAARATKAKAIGFEAARAAALGFHENPDGSTIFFFVVDPKLVPPERRAAVRKFIFEENAAKH